MKNYFLLLILVLSSSLYAQEIVSDEKVYDNAELDEKPTFEGGLEKFYKYVGKNFKTPEEVVSKGKIIIEFIIETDGSLSNFTVIQDVGFGSGKEAIRVLKECPKWNPAKKDGKAVRTMFKLPIMVQSFR